MIREALFRGMDEMSAMGNGTVELGVAAGESKIDKDDDDREIIFGEEEDPDIESLDTPEDAEKAKFDAKKDIAASKKKKKGKGK